MVDENNDAIKRPPALTMKDREDELIDKATREAERRIESGKASDSLLIHYLKLGTTKNQLEKEKLEAEVRLAESKTEALEQGKRIEELYADAIKAMRTYTGQGYSEEEDYEN